MLRLGIEAGSITFDVASEHGIRGVPISTDQLVRDGVEGTLAPLKARGLQVCQIGAFGFNPLSVDAPGQIQQKELLRQAIPLAVATGCPYIVINGGNYHPSGFGADDARNHTGEALDRLAVELEPFVKMAEAHGARISIEPYLKTAINSPERFLELHRKIGSDALCCNVDVTSLYAYHELLDPSPAVAHICKSLAGHYGLVHVKDIALKEGFHIHVELAPLGSSPTNWTQFFNLAAPHVPEDSWVILEHVQTREEARASLDLLRQAAQKAGVTIK
jgi:sugar phosphate isomerase/epimerase